MEHAQSTLTSEEFVGTVDAVKKAEAKAEKLLMDAKLSAERKEKSAKEKAIEITSKASDEEVMLKNKLLAEGRKEIEHEVSKVLSYAKAEATKVGKSRLGQHKTDELAKSVLGA